MFYDVETFHAGRPAVPFSRRRVVRATLSPQRLALHLALKRALDVAVAAGLLVAFSPLLLGIALAVRLIDGAPVLYRQERYGRNGTRFHILKFRTMRCDEPGERFVQVRRNDPRVTRLGALLRRSSLDELPQLINVLRGDMSLVGPRPHAVAMEEQNFVLYPGSAQRLSMAPGMTGLAQIRGQRGPTSAGNDLRARLDSDVEYTENWTLWRDLAILCKTPAAWLLGHNAH